jgi:broad-specificity NMP kinase
MRGLHNLFGKEYSQPSTGETEMLQGSLLNDQSGRRTLASDSNSYHPVAPVSLSQIFRCRANRRIVSTAGRLNATQGIQTSPSGTAGVSSVDLSHSYDLLPEAAGMLVHINSWPGAGKKTIGELLASRLNAKFIHNHHLLDLVEACCDRGDPEWQPLYDTIRKATYECLAHRPTGESLVMTNAVAKEETTVWPQICELATRRGDVLVPIVLTVNADENHKRLLDPGRTGSKLKSIQILDSLREKHELHIPLDIATTLVLDVSELSPEIAADHIEAHLQGISRC